MTMPLAFWILMLLWLVLAIWEGRNEDWKKAAYWMNSIPFMLLLLLGWRVFGAPIQ